MTFARRPLLLAGCALAMFASAGASHAQAGNKNPLEGRFQKIEGFAFDKLPLNDAIKTVHGNGKYRLAVFSDPNCGHCKRIDKDLKAIGNVTVYVFLYPVLGADSLAKARAIWCSGNRQKAWSDWIDSGTAPADAATACSTDGLQRGIDLGRQYKVEGTPTLVFSDGTRVPGAIPPPWISTLLEASVK
ncbi:DsbC family protein [Variovorax sp. EL159]|uniref:DsbC family protein n=1 Tax=Variovorax sp. EL159 TaxID=1566270 RepID=UPI000889F51E|nr:DsbC family protein [Variovorax sp. EL159]SCX58663.1 Thioredoxin-like domain-containing protein [Variovorax sp. EL159]